MGPLGLIPLPIPCAVRELGRRVLEFLNDIISFSKKNKKNELEYRKEHRLGFLILLF